MGTLQLLVAASHEVAARPGRLAKVQRLAELLRALPVPEIPIGVAFLSGEIGLEQPLGIGPSGLHQADPGTAREISSLELNQVQGRLRSIAADSGSGSATRKVQSLGALLASATRQEQDFLGRLLSGGLRQGAMQGLVLEAVARATDLSVDSVRRAVTLTGSLPQVAEAAFEQGPAGLSRFRLQLFRPLAPMLAQPAADLAEIFERLGQPALEYKLDGVRIQVHKQGDEVRVYTRGLHEVTAAVPEVVQGVAALPCQSLVLDGEVLALRADRRPHPFQTTMRRFGRKLEVEKLRAELPLTAFYFDCLQLDQDTLLDRPARERWAAFESLRGVQPPLRGGDSSQLVERIPHLVSGSPKEAQAFAQAALAAGHEGVLAKSPDSLYEAGGRGFQWLKLKPAHNLDLVVLAAEWGSGRRRGWLSNLHLGARVALTGLEAARQGKGAYVMLGKTFKGLTDQLLTWQTERLLQLEVRRDEYTVYVRPELVVEIAFSDVQASPHYPAGLALRFARVRRYRQDKLASEADTLDTVRAIYERGRA